MPATATKSKKKKSASVYITSQTALAKAMGYSNRSVVQSMQEHDSCPKKSKRGYHVPSWKKFNTQVWKPSREKNSQSDDAYAKARLRKLELENEERELKNAKARGELMGKDEVCSVLTEAFGAMVLNLNQQATRMAPEVSGLDAKEAMVMLRAENRAVLETFALGEWAKKKVFWQHVYSKLQSLHQTYSRGSGDKKT